MASKNKMTPWSESFKNRTMPRPTVVPTASDAPSSCPTVSRSASDSRTPGSISTLANISVTASTTSTTMSKMTTIDTAYRCSGPRAPVSDSTPSTADGDLTTATTAHRSAKPTPTENVSAAINGMNGRSAKNSPPMRTNSMVTCVTTPHKMVRIPDFNRSSVISAPAESAMSPSASPLMACRSSTVWWSMSWST